MSSTRRAVGRITSHYQIPYDKIVCGKLLAHRYIDDRAIPVDSEQWYE